MDLCTEERRATVEAMIEHFFDVPVESTSDEFIIALGMTLSAEIAARYDPSQWAERVEVLASLIMTDLLGGFDGGKTPN